MLCSNSQPYNAPRNCLLCLLNLLTKGPRKSYASCVHVTVMYACNYMYIMLASLNVIMIHYCSFSKLAHSYLRQNSQKLVLLKFTHLYNMLALHKLLHIPILFYMYMLIIIIQAHTYMYNIVLCKCTCTCGCVMYIWICTCGYVL